MILSVILGWMQEKNKPNSKDPDNKKSGWSSLIKFAAGAAIIAGVFSTNLSFNQTTDTGNFKNLQKKNTIELVEKNDSVPQDTIIQLDSIEHEKIITMPMDSILQKYGPEKWMEIIRKHTLIEINKIRKEFTDSVLIPDNKNYVLKDLVPNQKLNTSAQAYAEYMQKNNYFSHEGKDWSTFESRIKKTWYPFHFLWENLYRNATSIQDFILWRESSQDHYNVLKNKYYLHVWIGYYKWYIVGHFGWQK